MGLFDNFLGNNKAKKDNNELSLMDLLILNDMNEDKDINDEYEDYQYEEEELEEDDYFFEDDEE